MWRKSSYSGTDQGGACVEVALAWRKSTYSGSGDNGSCVEVAFTDQVGVRDSKNPEPTLTFPADRFREFLSHVRH